jgi:hypothetical protein
METEPDTPGEDPGAKNDDNPEPRENAGERGAGSATDALGGLEGGTEPEGEDVRDHERP